MFMILKQVDTILLAKYLFLQLKSFLKMNNQEAQVRVVKAVD